jgi:hypothetical protein
MDCDESRATRLKAISLIRFQSGMLRASGREMATMPGATSKKSILFAGVFCRFGKPE